MKKFCVALLLALSCMFTGGTTASAEPSAYAKSLMTEAEKGDAVAQYCLGFNYDLGEEGLPQDYQKAKIWYKKAAKQGHAKAQCSLGKMYLNGKGVRQDYHKAKEWYEKAAKQGDDSAQHLLGYLYATGKGVRQDYHKAKQWYEKSAKQGNCNSQNILGYMYENGLGVRQNLSEAKEWYGKACDNGDQKGCDAYARLNSHR